MIKAGIIYDECDSKLVVDAFSSKYMVPWRIRNRWKIASFFVRT